MPEFANSDEMSRRLLVALKISNSVSMFLAPTQQVTGAEENLFRLSLQLLIAAWKTKQGQVRSVTTRVSCREFSETGTSGMPCCPNAERMLERC